LLVASYQLPVAWSAMLKYRRRGGKKKNAGPFGPALQPMSKAAKGRFTPNRR
jgi:hypothetical protein